MGKKSEDNELKRKLTNATIFAVCGLLITLFEIVALISGIRIFKRATNPHHKSKAKTIIIVSSVVLAVHLILAILVVAGETTKTHDYGDYYLPTSEQLEKLREGEEELEKLRESTRRLEEYMNNR